MIVTTKSQSPSTKIGVSLAASAPFVFASNAIHILASRSDSESILVYLIASATQVAAAWLDMTAAFIRNSTLRRFIIPRAMLDTAADVYLAAIVAKRNDISRWTMIYFRLRIAVDICRIITSFATILSRDRSEKVGSATDRCQGDER